MIYVLKVMCINDLTIVSIYYKYSQYIDLMRSERFISIYWLLSEYILTLYQGLNLQANPGKMVRTELPMHGPGHTDLHKLKYRW